ncbi:opioid growth factor receptor-related protein [Simkania sp.]|uniref:opioid growth factor receptor-related protein n=1 Tax=Simkania sp. TaxID=34094 RepID=UPI003B52CF4F
MALHNLIKSSELLDKWAVNGLPQGIDAQAEAKKIQSYIDEVKAKNLSFQMMVYFEYRPKLEKGLELLRTASPIVAEKSASEVVSKPTEKKEPATHEKRDSEKPDVGKTPTPSKTESNGSSLVGTIVGGVIAVPKAILWTGPKSILTWAFTSKPTPVEKPEHEKAKPVEVIHTREEISAPEDTSRFQRTERIPVGLHNENGDDCFLNSVRQFTYNTPIAEHVLPTLPKENFPRTLKDCENYHAQRASVPMGGSRTVRNELLPPHMRGGHQDAHEALMQLFLFTDEKKNPLFNRIEGTRTYDLGSLPTGISYDDFTAKAKGYFQIGHQHNSGLNISTDHAAMPLLSIKTEGKKTLRTLQEVWDHHMNPPVQRVVPTTSVDEFGAYLSDSTTITRDMLDSGRIVTDRHGKYKALPDQVGEKFRFVEPPEHLLFSLKRYSRTLGVSTKIGDAVDMDPTFTLDHNHIKGNRAANYQIEAFMVQSGGLSGGHYISYIYDRAGEQWYRCNDSSVNPISTSEAKAAMRTAYSFYAKRVGEPFRSAPRALSTPVEPAPRREVSLSRKKDSTARAPFQFGRVHRIGTSSSRKTFEGTFIVGDLSQNDTLGGEGSANTHATGFLARTLNGSTITKDDIGPLLDQNVQTVRSRYTSSSKAAQQEKALTRIADNFVEELESFVATYKGFQSLSVPSDQLAQFFLTRVKDIGTLYQEQYKVDESSALTKALADLAEKRLTDKMTKDELTAEVKSLLRKDKAAENTGKEDRPSSEMTQVYPAFESAFGNAEYLECETLRLDSDLGMRKVVFQSILTAKREEHLDSNKTSAVGTVFSCNGSSHAIALVKQENGSVLYRIFDSQGNKELTGSTGAFIFETTDETQAAHFLAELVTYLPVEDSAENLNELTTYTFIPAKKESTSVLPAVGSALYNVTAYTLSTGSAILSAPFKGIYYLGTSLVGACRSKPSSPTLSKAVTVKFEHMSKESVGAELARIRSEVVLYLMGDKTSTPSDIARLADALSKVMPEANKYPELATTAASIEKSIKNLGGTVSVSTSPLPRTTHSTPVKVSKSPAVSDPRGMLPFYTGGKANVHGYTLEQILKFSDEEMERHHNFIQWIFPTSRVGVDPQAPLLDRGLISAAKSQTAFRTNMLRSFDKMLSYYGLERKGESVVKAANFQSRKKFWLINGKHNLLRMTRMITSMGDLGLKKEAKAFAECIIGIHERNEISGLGGSVGYWKSA